MAYKKYIRFDCVRFYPEGGLDDIAGSYDSLEEAKAAPFDAKGKFVGENDATTEIVDRDTWEVVWRDFEPRE